VARELGDDIETRSDPPPPTRRRAVRPWLEGAAVALLLVGIVYAALSLRSGSSDDGRRGGSATSLATTSTTLSPEADVEQAYAAFDAMLARLNPAPNPDDPEIAKRTTGEFRAQFERVLADRRARRWAVKAGPDYGPQRVATTVRGESATVQSCYVDQAAIVNVDTGAAVDPMTTVTEHQTLTFVREEGQWKLRRLVIDHDRQPGKLPDCKG
jgi:hypothetical protein